VTDVIPDRFDIAIPRGRRITAVASERSCLRQRHFRPRPRDNAGRDGLTLGLYSAERSLVDMVRLRHREGAEIARGALRRWLRRKGARPAALGVGYYSVRELARRVHQPSSDPAGRRRVPRTYGTNLSDRMLEEPAYPAEAMSPCGFINVPI
jgi:hypothetical protein